MISTVRDELLDYQSFVSSIKNIMIERMGQEYSIRVFKVIKNNSLELDSLVVLKEGKNCAPNIYLNAYYDAYISGTPMNEIVDRVCNIYMNCSIPIVQEDIDYRQQLMRSYILFR